MHSAFLCLCKQYSLVDYIGILVLTLLNTYVVYNHNNDMMATLLFLRSFVFN